MNIKKEDWHTCKICNKKITDLAKIYGGNGIYYSTVFETHLDKDHKMNILDYIYNFIEKPLCPCGICGQYMTINKKPGSNFKWKQPCGRYKGTMEWSEKAKISRCGSGNPMYKKVPWNLNKTFSDATKAKMQASAIKRIQRGDFKFTDTLPHKIACNILNKLKLSYSKEYLLGTCLYDIYLLDLNCAIEVDGDYWHCNPKFYPNGPINFVQEKTIKKDQIKNKFCYDNKISLIRIWEYDLLNNREYIECTLKELLVLKKLELYQQLTLK